MNNTVKTHAKKIADIFSAYDKFSADGATSFVGMGVTSGHYFKITNNKDEPDISYVCPIRNIEMALDILEESHKLLESTFDRNTCKKDLEALDFDEDLGMFLVYKKIPDLGFQF